MTNFVITGARVVTPDGVVETDVAVRGGKIRLAAKPRGSKVETINARDMILLPGFIDIHTHGYDGFDFTLGVYDPATDTFDGSRGRSLEALERYVGQMPSMGVCTSYLTTLAAETQTLRERLDILAEFLRARPEGTRVPGAFLEGTFISDQMLGAMNAEFVHRPNTRLFDELNTAGVIRLALVAPEGGRAAQTLIRHMARRGVIAGAGHTGATAAELAGARRAGLKYMVHFLNGPTGSSFKPFHGGGVVEGALADDKLFCELIADGYHVDPRYVRDVIARKGFDRIVAVSDSMFAAGAVGSAGGGKGKKKGFRTFQMNGVYGKVSPDGKYLQVAHNPKQLFGSCLDMPSAFGNLMSWLTRRMPGTWVRRHEALSPDDALVAAAKMTATNPARLTGLDKSLGVGAIANGRTADLVLARLAGEPGAWHLDVRRAWIAGREAFRS